MSAFVLTSHEGIYGIERTIKLLVSGSTALDAMEAGIKAIEDDPRAFTVGFGGAPNLLGEVELDASVMNGQTLESGAVGAITGCKHPISAARKVMEVLPHVFLVGAGASRFAREMGIADSEMLSDKAHEKYQIWLDQHLTKEQQDQLDGISLAQFVSFETRSNLSKGTVTFLVCDSQGNLFGGVSTSGWAYKYPGRLGDSPVIGAGLYVDRRYGGATCTHTGEMTIRACTARSVVLYLKKGATVEEACREALVDLKDLQGGYQGPVIIHAVDRHGKVCVVTNGGATHSRAYYWNSEMQSCECLEPVTV